MALIIGLAAISGSAGAGTLIVQINDGGGRALADAVVSLTAEAGDGGAPRPAPKEHYVDQQNETFIPAVEVFAVGDHVIFRNSDKTRHHVYSFSPLATFEYVLKPKEHSPEIKLLKPGIIAVGCNIHDFMLNYLYVTDARWADRSDGKGAVTLANVPTGAYIAHFWHPRLRPGAPELLQKVTLGDGDTRVTIALPVLPEKQDDGDKDRY